MASKKELQYYFKSLWDSDDAANSKPLTAQTAKSLVFEYLHCDKPFSSPNEIRTSLIDYASKYVMRQFYRDVFDLAVSGSVEDLLLYKLSHSWECKPYIVTVDGAEYPIIYRCATIWPDCRGHLSEEEAYPCNVVSPCEFSHFVSLVDSASCCSMIRGFFKVGKVYGIQDVVLGKCDSGNGFQVKLWLGEGASWSANGFVAAVDCLCEANGDKVTGKEGSTGKEKSRIVELTEFARYQHHFIQKCMEEGWMSDLKHEYIEVVEGFVDKRDTVSEDPFHEIFKAVVRLLNLVKNGSGISFDDNFSQIHEGLMPNFHLYRKLDQLGIEIKKYRDLEAQAYRKLKECFSKDWMDTNGRTLKGIENAIESAREAVATQKYYINKIDELINQREKKASELESLIKKGTSFLVQLRAWLNRPAFKLSENISASENIHEELIEVLTKVFAEKEEILGLNGNDNDKIRSFRTSLRDTILQLASEYQKESQLVDMLRKAFKTIGKFLERKRQTIKLCTEMIAEDEAKLLEFKIVSIKKILNKKNEAAKTFLSDYCKKAEENVAEMDQKENTEEETDISQEEKEALNPVQEYKSSFPVQWFRSSFPVKGFKSSRSNNEELHSLSGNIKVVTNQKVDSADLLAKIEEFSLPDIPKLEEDLKVCFIFEKIINGLIQSANLSEVLFHKVQPALVVQAATESKSSGVIMSEDMGTELLEKVKSFEFLKTIVTMSVNKSANLLISTEGLTTSAKRRNRLKRRNLKEKLEDVLACVLPESPFKPKGINKGFDGAVRGSNDKDFSQYLRNEWKFSEALKNLEDFEKSNNSDKLKKSLFCICLFLQIAAKTIKSLEKGVHKEIKQEIKWVDLQDIDIDSCFALFNKAGVALERDASDGKEKLEVNEKPEVQKSEDLLKKDSGVKEKEGVGEIKEKKNEKNEVNSEEESEEDSEDDGEKDSLSSKKNTGKSQLDLYYENFNIDFRKQISHTARYKRRARLFKSDYTIDELLNLKTARSKDRKARKLQIEQAKQLWK